MTKPKTTTDDNNNNNMSMLLVLFPQHNSTTTTNKLNSPIATKSLISKTQSTISICALLLFITLLLFTLSTLPNTPPSSPFSPPRFLLHNPKPLHKHHHFAFQKLGTLYRRGTKPMTDLIICHVSDQTPRNDFRFFLRLLHRSSLTASSDVVFIFSSPSSTLIYSPIILQENDIFTSLIHSNTSSFNSSRFFSFKETQIGEREPLWGPKLRTNFTTPKPLLSYGSILSFDATELDSENSLSGFLDRVPLSLRRWACYPMLLGRVRHNFKHVMLVDVKSVLILRDPLGRVRNRTADSVLVFAKHGKKTTQSSVSSAVVIGGARGVRRLSNAVLVEIVRAAIQHKKKRNSVTDSVVLSQLVSNEFMLRNKNVNLILSSELIPEASSLGGHDSGFSDYALILRGSSNYDLNSVIKKQICSSVLDSSVYSDC